MISRARRIRTYAVAALAVFGCLAVAACQSTLLPAASPASVALPPTPPAAAACGPSSDAVATWLRSQGFSAQAAKNFARPKELDCASVPAWICAEAESATALRAQGFSSQAIKNITLLAQRDC
jgi:hypothetical protein